MPCGSNDKMRVLFHIIMMFCHLCLILVGPGVPIMIGGASKWVNWGAGGAGGGRVEKNSRG